MLEREQLGQMIHEARAECEQHLVNSDSAHLVRWEERSECAKEAERKIGERFAHTVLDAMAAPISLEGIEQNQIIYHGQFSYLLQEYHPPVAEWCHLLVLKSKSPFSEHLLVVLTQQPGGSSSISRVIAGIAGYVMTFFKHRSLPDEAIMRPETTTFIEHLTVGCFGPGRGPTTETFAALEFDWETKGAPDGGPLSSQAHDPRWHLLTREVVQNLIERL